MPEKTRSFALLEEMSEFEYESDEAFILLKNRQLIEYPFDYFLQCISISRGYQSEHGSEECPSETEIINHVLQTLAGHPDQKWTDHKDKCYACEHTYETYKFLVKNIWKSLGSQEQYCLANIVLAYLRKDPKEEIAKIFGKFRVVSQSREMTSSENARFLKGVLTVRELYEENGTVKNIWYGLVRRENSVMGSTKCITAPFSKGSPVFRTDFTNEMDQFYFRLWNGIEIEGGLQFYFGPPDKLIKLDEGDFVQTVKGISVHNPSELTQWEATFYGVAS